MDKTVQTTLQGQKPKSLKPPHNPSIESKVERLDRVYGSGNDDNEQQLKWARLTQENLSLFNKMAKKKASALPESSGGPSTKTTSTTMSGFAIQAYKNGMLNPINSKPPTNLENILERHTRSRATACPSETKYKGYARTVSRVPNETSMVVEVSGHMLKKYDDGGYQRAFSQPFTGFPKDVGFNNGLSAPKPDFVEGLEMREFHPFSVDDHVNGAVLYKDDPNSLVLPHLAGEWKQRGKDMEVATLQSCYDGAALVYARNQALSYLGKPDPPGHAEVTTFTTDGTNVNFYAHYAAPAEDGALEYHQYHYASANVKDTYQGHKDGRRGLRNEQDHARVQSYALRDQLKRNWKQLRDGLPPVTEGAPLSVAGGACADEADYEVAEQTCQPTPNASLPPENDYTSSIGGNC